MLVFSACVPSQQITPALTVTATLTSTPTKIPVSLLPTTTPAPSAEQAFQEFKKSRVYQDALQNYLNYFWLKPENIQVQMQAMTLADQEYRFAVVTPDQSQLTEAQRKYADIYGPAPLFYAVQDKTTGVWNWDKEPPLRAFAKELGIKVGALGDRATYQEADMKKQFNIAIVSFINWQINEPRPRSLDMTDPDQIIPQLLSNEQEVISGHLITEGEYPGWLKEGNYSQIELEEIVRKHVDDVMTRYKGRVNYWIVLNEFHPYDLAHGWYNDYLAERLGWEKLINIAFDEARKNDPDAVLIVNDFCNYFYGDINNGNKLTQDVEVIRALQQQGMSNLAIGMQMHINQGQDHMIPNSDQLSRAIKTYRDLGVEVYITEMDVNISPQSRNGSVPFRDNDRYLQQAEIYYQILGTYLANTEEQKNRIIVSWDFRDARSWEVALGFEDPAPLLFDDQGNPKPAYYAYLRVLYSAVVNSP